MRRLRTIRATILRRAFELLYGPLLFLHEPAGWILFGRAWRRRRSRLLTLCGRNGITMDLGCGSGILLEEAAQHSQLAFGVDRSQTAAERASKRGVLAVCGDARCLPVQTSSVETVVCSYPGPWIVAPECWAELARVLRPEGTVTILLGGTIERGEGGRLRSLVIRLVYGHNSTDAARLLAGELGHPQVPGTIRILHDQWGAAVYWVGQRV